MSRAVNLGEMLTFWYLKPMRNISEILVLVIFQKIQIKQHVNADTFLQKSPFKFHEFDFHNCKYALKELVVGIILRQRSQV